MTQPQRDPGENLSLSDSLLVLDFTSLDSEGRPRPLAADSELSAEFSFDAVQISWGVGPDCVPIGRSP